MNLLKRMKGTLLQRKMRTYEVPKCEDRLNSSYSSGTWVLDWDKVAGV
jgi:hypothetical protein